MMGAAIRKLLNNLFIFKNLSVAQNKFLANESCMARLEGTFVWVLSLSFVFLVHIVGAPNNFF